MLANSCRRSRAALVSLVAGAALLASACATASKAPSSPGARATDGFGYGASGAQPQQGYPSPSPPPPPGAPAPAQSPEAAPSTPSAPAQPAGGASAPTDRSLALRAASSEVESSQRELDVAGSDCRNACRALGSMDRAAGRLCELSQSSDDGTRCRDAKKRVYSARDRVRTNCGSCPNGPSVERTAPIPSLP